MSAVNLPSEKQRFEKSYPEAGEFQPEAGEFQPKAGEIQPEPKEAVPPEAETPPRKLRLRPLSAARGDRRERPKPKLPRRSFGRGWDCRLGRGLDFTSRGLEFTSRGLEFTSQGV